MYYLLQHLISSTTPFQMAVYPVSQVLDFAYQKKVDRMYLKTEWDQELPSGRKAVSAIPLENFIESSEAIYRFSLTLRDQTGRHVRAFPKKHFRRVLHCEYVPSPDDLVRKIHYSFSEVFKRGSEEFYRVRLIGRADVVTIRLIFMEFFFPFDLLCYWKRSGRAGPKFET
jgi:hypothetical protein